MDSKGIPVDTCPLCRQRALSWIETICTCRSCGSAFEIDTVTRRCRYTYVASAYRAIEPALTQGWISRRDVFEFAATVAPRSALIQPRPQPTVAAPAQNDTRTPFKYALVFFIGVVSLFPILCACIAVLALAPGMSQTRQLIAAANILTSEANLTVEPGQALSTTTTPFVTLTQTVVDPSGQVDDSIQKPLETLPVQSRTAQPTARVTARPVITPVSPLKSPLGTPTGLFSRPGGTATPFNALGTPGVNQNVTPVLPPTFTPIPVGPIIVSTPTPSAISAETVTPTITPVLVIVVTATVTPAPSPTPNGLPVIGISSTVVISAVMYAGTASSNMADQYIEVQNRGSGPVSIGNWRVHSESADKDSYFTNGLVLLPGQTCRIYGSSPPLNASSCGSFSFNSSTPVWSTVADTALLYNDQGELVGSYSYTTQR